MFEPIEREYVAAARVGRLATADADGRPHVVPICFALLDDDLVTAVDEKPQSTGPSELRRSRNIRENAHAAVVVDHYAEEWSTLGWVQIRGGAEHLAPTDAAHADAVAALREKYDQYETHDLDSRPVIRITPGTVRSWGRLDPAAAP